MARYKILFPIETAARELLYKLVLSGRFAELGYECYIGSKSEIFSLFSQVRPFAYFDKGYHAKVSEAIYTKVKENGGIIINLDEEGGVDFKHSHTVASRYPEVLFDICDLIFLWGDAQYRLLKEQRDNFKDDKIVVSGHPRFELLQPPYHGLYQDEVERIQARFGKYILINTNMGFGNNIRGDRFARENYEGRVKNLEKVMAFDRKKIAWIISLVEQLAASHPYAIVVRPHPEESHEVYRGAWKGLPHVHVVYEGSVLPWILGAEAIIHPDCTTGIEAAIMGKRPISYLPEYDEETCTHLPVRLSVAVRNEEEVIGYLADVRSFENGGIQDSILEDFFSLDRSSTNIIVDAVHNLLRNGRIEGGKDLPWHYPVQGMIKETLRPLYYRVRERGSYRLSKKKLQGFNLRAVVETFETIRETVSIERTVSLQEISHNLYRVART